MSRHTMPGMPNLVTRVGVSERLLKHDAKGYKVISVPKSAVLPPC